MTTMKPRKVELLWFGGCPNHEDARRLLHDVLADVAPETRTDTRQPATASDEQLLASFLARKL